MRLGLPRGLHYYRHFPFWQTFFQELGCQVVVSGQTTKEILDKGIAHTVDGFCLPVKIYVGHVLNLMEKNVDYIFVPRMISIAKREYICPKFMGLPDIVKNSIDNCPPLLEPVIDGRKSGLSILKAYIRMGTKLTSVPKAMLAYQKALGRQHQHERDLVKDGKRCPLEHLTIGVLGHEYLLYDDYINLGTMSWLKQAGCHIISMDQLPTDIIQNGINTLHFKKMFWTPGKELLGAYAYFSRHVDGIISMVAFSCGSDALTVDIIERYSRRNHIPHLQLSLDEHTGEAGIHTRLEAFIELLKRRKLIEANHTAHG